MKLVTVVGARPQFIKAAVLRRLFSQNDVHEVLIHSGQHYDHNMSEVFFEELEIIPPNHYIDLENRSHGAMTGEILTHVERILTAESPDACLVYGDTNSTLAGSLAAAKMGIPVCHVEAGLRSFNRAMPEEINRVATDHVSDVLFCSTRTSVENLNNENITRGVHHVGDIMYDAVLMFADQGRADGVVSKLPIDATKPLAVMTVHRQDTVNSFNRLHDIIAYCRGFDESYTILFPAHPRTSRQIADAGIELGGIRIIEPVPYLVMQALLAKCQLVLTDSGGMQKEAYFHRVRCVTLREETEWVETIEAGWNRLWTDPDYCSEPRNIDDYGNGDSGQKMIEVLFDEFG